MHGPYNDMKEGIIMRIMTLLIATLLAVPSFAQEHHQVPVVGHTFKFDFGKYSFELDFKSDTLLTIALLKGSEPGPAERVRISRTEIRPNVYMVTWQERSGTTVTDVQDFSKGIVYANVTEPGGHFEHWKGKITELK